MYKSLLYVLRSIMMLKQFLVVILQYVVHGLRSIERIYQMRMGFSIYKTFFYLTRAYNQFSFTKKESKLEFFGRRGTLQLLLFFVVISIMVPHSRLYSKEYNDTAGRNSLLYALVGPGDQEFVLDAVVQSEGYVPIEGVDTWNQGAMLYDAHSGDTNYTYVEPLSSLSMRGTAVSKPYIMSGIDIQEVSGNSASPAVTNRKDSVYYTVQQGDVIGQIAQQFGIGIQTIFWANDLSATSYIRPGDELIILPVDGISHTVKSGQTISQIARIYDADMDDIVDLNDIHGSAIQIGQDIIIPGGVKPVPERQYARAVTPRQTADNNTVVETPVVGTVAPPPSVEVPSGGGYLWPTAATIITQYYGWRHNGADIAGPMDTAIYATKAGKITIAQCGWNYGYGCYIKIDHGNGVESLYAHNSKFYVSVGDYVTQGQTIAGMGSTGNSTGPHTHFEIHVNGVRQNPFAYVKR